MLELIDLNQRLSRKDYDLWYPQLETELGNCQRAARKAGLPMIWVFEGWHAAGKGVLINRLTQTLDPRGFRVHLVTRPTAEESRRPWLWRYWMNLPSSGEIVIFDHSWYYRVLEERLRGDITELESARAYAEILEFERQLTAGGTLIHKFWLHVDAKEQRKRFRRLRKDPATAWKVTRDYWRQNRDYERWVQAVEETLACTNTADAPWTIIEATQAKFARVKVFRTLTQRVRDALAAGRDTPPATAAPAPVPEANALVRPTILDRVDLTLSLTREEYERKLRHLRSRLYHLEHQAYLARIPVVIAYEGWDAAGKGGNIKRLTRGLDPRGYQVVPIGPPTDEERRHHYLWRFWRHIPKTGHITIFDRSWYGRVLVERVEGFCAEREWKRAFSEINEFEHQLADFGTVIVKFWLHIDQEEQLRRFQERVNTPSKQWKITEEDWRNREKWAQYELAVVEMLERTSTIYAPWTILEANCKLYARIKALQTVADAIDAAIKKRKH